MLLFECLQAALLLAMISLAEMAAPRDKRFLFSGLFDDEFEDLAEDAIADKKRAVPTPVLVGVLEHPVPMPMPESNAMAPPAYPPPSAYPPPPPPAYAAPPPAYPPPSYAPPPYMPPPPAYPPPAYPPPY